MNEDEIHSIMDECHFEGYDYTRAGLIAAIMGLQIVNRRLFIIVINSVMKLASQILVGRGVMMVGMGGFHVVSAFFVDQLAGRCCVAGQHGT